MKRPLQVSTLISTVRAALRDRRRQYSVRDLLAERQRAARRCAERERYRVTLASIGDAVIATDTQGRVTFLNEVAEQLTGWDLVAAQGRPLEEIFHIVNETTRSVVSNPALRALKEGVIVGLANHTILIARHGIEHPLDDSAAPIRGASGEIIGTVLVFRDITERKRLEAAQKRGRPAKGRFHRPSRPRAQEPASPDPEWPAGYAARGRRRQCHRAGTRHDGTAAGTHGASHRRPPRHLPDQPQQNGAAPVSHPAVGRGEQRGGDRPAQPSRRQNTSFPYHCRRTPFSSMRT